MSSGDQSNELRTSEPETTTGSGQQDSLPADSADSARQKARILIAEDEAWDAELAQRLLTGAGLGFTAVVVDTRASFVEQLAAFRPDVILSDFHMPGFSGETALEIAKEQCP